MGRRWSFSEDSNSIFPSLCWDQKEFNGKDWLTATYCGLLDGQHDFTLFLPFPFLAKNKTFSSLPPPPPPTFYHESGHVAVCCQTRRGITCCSFFPSILKGGRHQYGMSSDLFQLSSECRLQLEVNHLRKGFEWKFSSKTKRLQAVILQI